MGGGWGTQEIVKAEEMGDKIRQLMENQLLQLEASRIKEEARKAVEVGGSSDLTMQKIIQNWKNNTCSGN